MNSAAHGQQRLQQDTTQHAEKRDDDHHGNHHGDDCRSEEFVEHLLCCFLFFFFNDTATTEIYTLSLHDALPIYRRSRPPPMNSIPTTACSRALHARSEEHTSELQSHSDIVCRLLLEKKKKK